MFSRSLSPPALGSHAVSPAAAAVAAAARIFGVALYLFISVSLYPSIYLSFSLKKPALILLKFLTEHPLELCQSLLVVSQVSPLLCDISKRCGDLRMFSGFVDFGSDFYFESES